MEEAGWCNLLVPDIGTLPTQLMNLTCSVVLGAAVSNAAALPSLRVI